MKVSIPLNIPDVEVIKVETVDGELVITVESTLQGTIGTRCGRPINQFAGYNDPIQVRHLPCFGQTVWITYRPKRYECPDCDGQPKTTQTVGWHAPRSPYTRAYEDHILKALINSTLEDVSQKEGLGYGGVRGIVRRRLATVVDWSRYVCLRVIGIDEIALKKGYRDFVVIVSAHLDDGQVVVLGILPNREAKTLEAFLKGIPDALRATIANVGVDMYETYRQVVKTVLPQAQVVVDRFHVARTYREAADQVRKTEMKRLKQHLPKATYATLKPARRAFWKNRNTLNPDERQALNRLFTYAPSLRLVYDFREGLRTIFARPLSKAQAQDELKTWQFLVREQHLICFEPFLKTLANFFDEITNFFVHRLTSGFVEGLNNKIKVLKRRCFGIFNLGHFFQRLFLDLEGYMVFAP
jgi:transposase